MILAACVCDGLDGYLARLLKAESTFGKHLDSFADIVSFGLAPMLIISKSFANYLNIFTLIPMYLFIIAAIYRLIRFNIYEFRDYFSGLPTTMAAAILVVITLLLRMKKLAFTAEIFYFVIGLILLLSLLMVLRFRFPKIF